MSRAMGRYELLRPLARGGMGEVYLARRRTAGVEKWLVVKRMRPEKTGDARFLDLFVREARLSMSLAHQNIVPVFDFGRIDDQVFLAMERVEGKDLGSSLQAAGKGLPALLAAFVAGECCQALDYAHRRKAPDGTPLGIVHRDVTPRNVLLSWSGEVKLTDFGIAALAGDQGNKAVGTPAYMAPEQARGEPLDGRADVYSIGMVLWEALTGKRPRPGSDREATMAAARTGQLAAWPDEVATELRAVVEKATAAAAEDRYQDARGLLEALDAFMVTERAAHKSESPARLLAAWLADVWKDERDEGAIEEAIEGEHLVSFLDDGALDVIGTGTQRSMLATAAEDAAAKPAPAPEPAPEPETPVVAPKRRWVGAIAAGVLLLGGGAVAWQLLGNRSEESPSPQPSPQPSPSPSPSPSLSPSPSPSPPPSPSPSPSLSLSPSPSPPQPEPPPKKKIIAKVVKQPPKVQPVAVTRHKVLIGSVPWSYWTVDDDPTKHEGKETIDLTPGPHRVHYLGQPDLQVDKTVTIEVPDAEGFKHSEKLGP